MKAIIQFFNTGSGTHTLKASKVIEGKDLRIHIDGVYAYHITDAYHNHKMIGAYSGVESIELEGKPKVRKPKKSIIETLKVEIDNTQLLAALKEAMLELEGLADKEQFIHKEDIDDDYLNRNCSQEVLAQYGVTATRTERDQLQKEVNELREQIQQLAFVPPDVATAAQLLDAELLVFLDHVTKQVRDQNDIIRDTGFGNGMRFAISKLTGEPPEYQPIPFNKSETLVACTSASLMNTATGEVILGDAPTPELPKEPRRSK